MKRHVSEVLDADGVPIHVGDTVWMTYEPCCNQRIKELLPYGFKNSQKPCVIYESGRWDIASNVTHRQPDTLERIEEDARKELWHYWGCSGARCAECPALIDGKTPEDHYHTDSCADAKVLDLLRRQRLVLERGQA